MNLLTPQHDRKLISTSFKVICLLLFPIFAVSCSDSIVLGSRLDNSNIEYIRQLDLLDKDEQIDMFYSSISYKTTGSFISNKRIGSYLLYENNPNRHKDFAYYGDIDSLSSDFSGEFGVGNKIFVTKKDGEKFIVNVNGTKSIMNEFFSKALQYWHASRDSISLRKLNHL